MTLEEKLVSDGGLAAAVEKLARPLVFTNGVFDLMHPGHVLYLEEARAMGASLVVGLNSDSSARLLGKGDDRPINSETDRAVMLAALASVSLVVSFNEPTPVALMKRVRPDIYVKGGDYRMEMLEETKLIQSWGGNAYAIPFREGYSTTRLVERIRSLAP